MTEPAEYKVTLMITPSNNPHDWQSGVLTGNDMLSCLVAAYYLLFNEILPCSMTVSECLVYLDKVSDELMEDLDVYPSQHCCEGLYQLEQVMVHVRDFISLPEEFVIGEIIALNLSSYLIKEET